MKVQRISIEVLGSAPYTLNDLDLFHLARGSISGAWPTRAARQSIQCPFDRVTYRQASPSKRGSSRLATSHQASRVLAMLPVVVVGSLACGESDSQRAPRGAPTVRSRFGRRRRWIIGCRDCAAAGGLKTESTAPQASTSEPTTPSAAEHLQSLVVCERGRCLLGMNWGQAPGTVAAATSGQLQQGDVIRPNRMRTAKCGCQGTMAARWARPTIRSGLGVSLNRVYAFECAVGLAHGFVNSVSAGEWFRFAGCYKAEANRGAFWRGLGRAAGGGGCPPRRGGRRGWRDGFGRGGRGAERGRRGVTALTGRPSPQASPTGRGSNSGASLEGEGRFAKVCTGRGSSRQAEGGGGVVLGGVWVGARRWLVGRGRRGRSGSTGLPWRREAGRSRSGRAAGIAMGLRGDAT